MVIVRLNGGLGNQLFQFSTGKAIASRFSAQLVVDDRVFQEDAFRSFCLPRFNAVYKLASEDPLVESMLPPPRKHWLAFLRWRLSHGRRLRFVKECSLEFEPQVLMSGSNVYLHGYWQSEKYFQGVSDLLRQELTVQEPPSVENQLWLKNIAEEIAVSIHVRRGDYVSDPKANRVHGTCSLDYYRLAAERIAREISSPFTFYVFSDAPDWVAENLSLPFPMRYVRHNDDASNYEDLRLMMACHHHIIANSSFSWWGAWLGHNQTRVVIAPRAWFKDSSRSDRSLVPERWIRL